MTEEEERLIKKYKNRVTDKGIYFYWDEEKNGTFSLPYYDRTYFNQPKSIQEHQSIEFTDEHDLLELKEEALVNYFNSKNDLVNKNGRIFLKIRKTKPGKHLVKNFIFLNSNIQELYKVDYKLSQQFNSSTVQQFYYS